MKDYNHKDIEKKWQDEWQKSGIYKTPDVPKKKAYVLDMFPYPSGEGLHVGHPKGYIATDVYSRMKRMQGYSVLHPMGWDAFGLPAENYALKTKTHPSKAVAKNVARYKEQLSIIGFDYDWTREIDTTDPKYYKWTQWIFLKLLEKGLAVQSFAPINWCPSCQTGLANEDVEADGTCERCGTKVEKRPMRQWVLKITDYAERLLADIDQLTRWPEHIKEMQRNWIGKSEGAEIYFELKFTDAKQNENRDPEGNKARIPVFTTRPDTLYGATYMVLAPEHPWVTLALDKNHKGILPNVDEVRAYVEGAKQKGEIERTAEGKEKTGVELQGVKAINPATKEEIPMYVADYVLGHYGTGAVMAVPAHDERDYAFAKKYDLPIKQVVMPCMHDLVKPPQPGLPEVARDTVVVFLKDTATGKYAVLDWHGAQDGVSTGIMGGIENGDTPEEAALGEIREEASIPNARIVHTLRWTSAATYCAAHKGENRRATARAFLAEVDGLAEQGAISAEEDTKHTLAWITEDELLKRTGLPEHQRWLWQQLHIETPLIEGGALINSGEFDGTDNEEAKKKITEAVGGKMVTTYKLQDWVFSRQRYWGEPIPVIHCEKDGVVPVPEKDLPVVLPEVEHYEPTGTGESPLANIPDWVNTTCPKCGGPAKRETNTMPQWAGSSWYYLRYMDPDNNDVLVDPKKEKAWAPVDLYVGGAEHATRHLIYARFWHKFLYDQGVVSSVEPFTELHSVGLIQAEDGRKMSKRWGNVINPDDIVDRFGADSLRVYEMFMGPFGNAIAWSTNGLVGARRFIERIWRLSEKAGDEIPVLETVLNFTIQKVGVDIAEFKFNTAVSQMMILLNAAEAAGIGRTQLATFLKLVAPFAPHVAEELWQGMGNKGSVHLEEWPTYDPAKLVAETVVVAIQVGGKMKGTIQVPRDSSQDEVLNEVRKSEKMAQYMAEKPSKVIFVANKIINLIP